jgi:HAD superfamily hydrolase (TIGR01484 family)
LQLHYLALAADGDGTLTVGGRMAKRTVQALECVRASGRSLILVTGESRRELAKFPHLDLFDPVVAENGATLYRPSTGAEKLLCDLPPSRLRRALRRAGVKPLKAGRVVLSTKSSQERRIRATLQHLGLDYQLIRNRHDLLLLPPGIDKATGLAAALKALNLPAHRVVAVGDADNDKALLDFCGVGVAVANAVPLVKQHAHFTTSSGAGRGVVELIERLLRDDLQGLPRRS